ncbi:MAG: tetratricopeptide repeat protein [Bauldia sp.]
MTEQQPREAPATPGRSFGAIPTWVYVLVIGIAVYAVRDVWEADWRACNGDDWNRRIAGCTRLLEQNAQSTKDRAYIFFNRGFAYAKQHDFDQGIADFAKAIELVPGYVEAYDYRGLSYASRGDLDLAIADHTRAIELKPTNVFSYTNLGLTHHMKGDLDRAVADYTKAIELDPKSATAYLGRGNAHLSQGDAGRASADYSKVLELAPNDPRSLTARVNLNLLAAAPQAPANSPLTTSPNPAFTALIHRVVRRRLARRALRCVECRWARWQGASSAPNRKLRRNWRSTASSRATRSPNWRSCRPAPSTSSSPTRLIISNSRTP